MVAFDLLKSGSGGGVSLRFADLLLLAAMSPDALSARAGGFGATGRGGTVQVAGSNVSCAHVASVLGEHPGIGSCAVRLMGAHEGSRLKAFVVVRAGCCRGSPAAPAATVDAGPPVYC